MNPELHHKWNSVRTSSRGSDKEGKRVSENQIQESKVTLKQSKPR